jgi:hypothetical protein
VSYEERPRAQLRGLEAPQTEPARRLSARSPRDREHTQVKTNHTARTIRKKRTTASPITISVGSPRESRLLLVSNSIGRFAMASVRIIL